MNEELMALIEQIIADHSALLDKLKAVDGPVEDVPADAAPTDVMPVEDMAVEDDGASEAGVSVEIEVNVGGESEDDTVEDGCCPTCGQAVPVPMATDMVEAAAEQRELRWFSSPSPVSEKRTLATTAMPLELRELPDGQVGLSGYAAVFNSPSLDMGFIERIAPGAFKRSLAMDGDVRLLVEHDGVAIARTKSGTLSVFEDSRGLKIDATVDPTNPKVAEVMSAIRRGDLDAMSFGFRTIRKSYDEERGQQVLEECALYEVSLVSFPAYEATSVQARSESAAGAETVARSRMARARVRLLDI